jgi:hypothetical protein
MKYFAKTFEESPVRNLSDTRSPTILNADS